MAPPTYLLAQTQNMAFIIYFSCSIHHQFLMILSSKPFPPAPLPLPHSVYIHPIFTLVQVTITFSSDHYNFLVFLFFFFCPSVIYSPDSFYVNHTKSLLCLRAITGFMYITLKLKPEQECAPCFLFSLILGVPPVVHSLPSILPALSSLDTHDLSSSGLFALAFPECCFPALAWLAHSHFLNF